MGSAQNLIMQCIETFLITQLWDLHACGHTCWLCPGIMIYVNYLSKWRPWASQLTILFGSYNFNCECFVMIENYTEFSLAFE